MKTPYFLIHQELLQENIESFTQGMCANWNNSRFGYSVKTNSLPWLLSYVRLKGGLAEVVSDEEYDLALLCGFLPNEIIFNGPIKGKDKFYFALEHGSIVNIDSENEIRWIEEYEKPLSDLGIRINVPSEVFNSEDIEYTNEGFRFGFSVENGAFEKALKRISKKYDIRKIGLHLHCNSITRSKEVYRAIAKYTVGIIDKYNLEPRYIDVGGGFFGGVPGKTTINEYFSIISDEFKKCARTRQSLLIAEPGSAIVGSVIDLHTSVLDVKDTNCSHIVTTDGGRVYLDPQWFRTRYMYSIRSKSEKKYSGKQIICGYTCMDHDRIMEIENELHLQMGDEIIYHRVGAYTVTFGGLFIKFLPEVYVSNNGETELIRSSMTVDEYYKIQSAGGR